MPPCRLLSFHVWQANSTPLLQLMGPQELMYMSPETQATWLNGACQMPGTMIRCLVGAGGVGMKGR